MEKLDGYKCSDGKIFKSRKEALAYETSLRASDIVKEFVDTHYKKNMSKDEFKTLLAVNLRGLADLYNAAKPKQKRKSNKKTTETKETSK